MARSSAADDSAARPNRSLRMATSLDRGVHLQLLVASATMSLAVVFAVSKIDMHTVTHRAG